MSHSILKNKIAKNLSVVLALITVSSSLVGCQQSGSDIDPFKYIELGQYKGLDIERMEHEVTEDDMEAELLTLAGAYAKDEVLTEGTVKKGDVANIDYMGMKDGVAFDGGTASGYDLEIGSGNFIPGFEDGLIGTKVGDTVDLDLVFPEQYHSAELAGAQVVFTVTVNYITRPVIPEITDDFISEISAGKFSSVDEYNEALRQQIASEYAEADELQYYEDLWNAAVENATIIKDIPNDLIIEKTSKMVLNAQEYAKTYNMSFDDFLNTYMGLTKDEFNAQAAEYAKTASKESLVLKAIATTENITVTEEELNEAIDEYVAFGNYASRDDFLKANDKSELEEYVLLSKVEEFLAENAK